MNEKKTIQNIIEILSEKQGMDKKDAELFVKGMFDLIEEALATEKYVKVKGLGTFKRENALKYKDIQRFHSLPTLP